MKKLFSCRRTVVSVIAIVCLTILGLYHGVDISGIAIAIAGVAGSLSGANAWESKGQPKSKEEKPAPIAEDKPKVDNPD